MARTRSAGQNDPAAAPEFPLTVIYDDGHSETIESRDELIWTLEWFDSDNPLTEAQLHDARGRRVRLILQALNIKVLELEAMPAEGTVRGQTRSEEVVVGLIIRDLSVTLGDGYDDMVRVAARRLRELVEAGQGFEERLVEEVQQTLHDTFTDTSWPKCPDHPGHPLWYSDGWWRCDATDKQIARLGELVAGTS